ncbi:MAG: nucleotidyltransferase family protein [Candidatus Diapherotrites archaeon]|nr:nucleotidyltransferase family protein [Candidatus Diapherotrites archaeon]
MKKENAINEKTKTRKAFVLAGGMGLRLRPFTLEIPKPMLLVKGRPILEYNIRNLIEHGVKQIILGVSHKNEVINDYFGKKFDGARITYCKEEKLLGTAGALKNAEKYLKGKSFFVCNGDEVKDVNYSKMALLLEKKKALGVIALKKLKNIENFGVVELEGNKVLRFIEKPKSWETESRIVNAGAYALSNKILRMIPKKRRYSLERDVFPVLSFEQSLYGCKCVGQWFPTDTPEKYEIAIKKATFFRRWFDAYNSN